MLRRELRGLNTRGEKTTLCRWNHHFSNYTPSLSTLSQPSPLHSISSLSGSPSMERGSRETQQLVNPRPYPQGRNRSLGGFSVDYWPWPFEFFKLGNYFLSKIKILLFFGPPCNREFDVSKVVTF